uniref:GDP-fucose protein O-fucosyltransferase 2 n=1 Tax=Eutreptiella gymnastica TaxID=73025 RepID=A0A7S4LFE3_9EUGL
MDAILDWGYFRAQAQIPVVLISKFLKDQASNSCMVVELHKPDEGQKRSFLSSGTGQRYDYFQRIGLLPEDKAQWIEEVRSLHFAPGGTRNAEMLSIYGKEPYASSSLLAFTYMYYVTHPGDMPAHVPRAVRYALPFRAAATSAVSTLGGPQEYDCLHLRRGDFEQYCQFIVEEHDITAAEKGNTCWPSLPCLARRLQRHFLAQSPPSSPLYISSNVELAASDMLSVLNSAAPDRPLYTKENFTALFETYPTPLLAPVDQLVCSDARYFIGNEFSSFSIQISRLRSSKANHDSRFIGDREELVAYHSPLSVYHWLARFTSYTPQLCS